MANTQSPKGPPGPRRKDKGPKRRGPWARFFYWSAVVGVWGLIFLTSLIVVFAWDLPDISRLYDVKRQPTISYLDRSGALIAMRGSASAPPVDMAELPAYVPDAFIAVEDQRFYYHMGFDPIGITRAARNNLFRRKAGQNLAGGSTITQQLARNIFLSPDQNWRRKIQEVLLAVELEIKYSKKEILALYLNRVPFGGGANGIEAAAKRYFDKQAKDLTLGEAALLAASVKGPSRYNPAAAPERTGRRATMVLNQMYATRRITRAQLDGALSEHVLVRKTLANQNAGYFVDWVDAKVRTLVGDPTEDLVVETTLDLPIQMAGETAVQQIIARDAATRGIQQGALVAIDGDGRVRAYLGGSGYDETQFDRAANAQRQAGSSFKPFVYLTAMEQGRTPDQTVVDEPFKIGNWQPHNYTGRYLGTITLQTALAQSINTVAARLASEVGTANVAETARRLGITGHIQTDPSMALGAVEVTPVQMAQAYAPFANGGFVARAYGIERIRTSTGRILYDHGVERAGRGQVVGSPALQEMNQMLRQVILSGTGTRARIPGYDLAGKTGTTSDYKDAWFIGYTGGFIAAVWVGKDDNTPMARGVTGGGPPAEIWHNFMAAALPRLRVAAIPGGEIPPPQPDVIGGLIEGPTPEPGAPPTEAAPPAQPAPRPPPNPNAAGLPF
ncbi:MAG: penicillin-binding protein [Caulobacteraceae bacterium]|nr:penicillin-binding protein [Caulobacteraceae bacterium]